MISEPLLQGLAAAEPPSRASNPFATCWTRPGALPWFATEQVDPQAAVRRLQHAGWRGQLVGPHGAGKSTLLRSLVEPLRLAGREPVWIDATRDWSERDGIEAFAEALSRPAALLLVEGFERLSRPTRRQWLAALRRARAGCLVTTHCPLRSWRDPLAVVASLRPSARLLAELYGRLTRERPTGVTLDEALASFATRGGDLRAVWFDLYNLHEARSRSFTSGAAAERPLEDGPRSMRTGEPVVAYLVRPVGLHGSGSS